MDRFQYKPIRDKQMMAAAEKYADSVKSTFESENELSICLNDFKAGWEMADIYPAWVSVEDELPEKDGRYLFYDEILGPLVYSCGYRSDKVAEGNIKHFVSYDPMTCVRRLLVWLFESNHFWKEDDQ